MTYILAAALLMPFTHPGKTTVREVHGYHYYGLDLGNQGFV